MESNRIFSTKKKILFYTVMLLLPFSVITLAYISYTGYKSSQFYRNLKTNQPGWAGKVYVADAQFGYVPVPNSEGSRVTPMGPNVPVRWDEDGFRVPLELDEASDQRPLILSLGCSFTFGELNYARDTFPYLIGRSLKGTSKNAAVGGYGLSQMLLLAEELVPIHKPDYLLVQYSPWLVNRAQYPFAPSNWGITPTPFFYEKDRSFALSPPVFLSKIQELPVDRYRDSPTNWLDAFSFYWNVGLPLIVHDDFNMLKFRAYSIAGAIPRPTSSRRDLIKHVYERINNVANEFDARVIIVVLGNNENPVPVDQQLFPPDALLVYAHDTLLERLPNPNRENYLDAYAYRWGSPPTNVDRHPNKAAHKLIAEAVVSAITQDEMESPKQARRPRRGIPIQNNQAPAIVHSE